MVPYILVSFNHIIFYIIIGMEKIKASSYKPRGTVNERYI